MPFLSSFASAPMRFALEQKESMQWIERAHATSEARLRGAETAHFAGRIASLLSKLTKGTETIERRHVA